MIGTTIPAAAAVPGRHGGAEEAGPLCSWPKARGMPEAGKLDDVWEGRGVNV